MIAHALKSVLSILAAVAAFVGLGLVGCVSASVPRQDVVSTRIERDLGAALSVGDSSGKIERVLLDQGLPFSFDGRRSRYQCRLDLQNQKQIPHVVIVFVYVDATKHMTRIEVSESRALRLFPKA